MPLEVLVNLEFKIRFKLLKIAKRIKDLRAAFTKRVNEFIDKHDEDMKPRIISTSVCMVGVTAIIAHNISASLNATGRTMAIRKLILTSVVVGGSFAYIWWRMPSSAMHLSGDDVDTVFSIVRESGHAPSEHMQPIVDFLHAGIFQSGAYQPIEWEDYEDDDEDDDEDIPGYEQFVHDKSKLPTSVDYDRHEEPSSLRRDRFSESIPRYEKSSERIVPTQSLRNLRTVVKDPNTRRAATNGSVLTSLLNTASTSDRRIDPHEGGRSAQDLPFDWIGSN